MWVVCDASFGGKVLFTGAKAKCEEYVQSFGGVVRRWGAAAYGWELGA